MAAKATDDEIIQALKETGGQRKVLLVGTLFLVPVIVIYTSWLYWVFRGKIRAGVGYHRTCLHALRPSGGWRASGLRGFLLKSSSAAAPTDTKVSWTSPRVWRMRMR